LLLAATVRSFAHMPLGISDRNTNIQELNVFGIVQQRFSKQHAAVLVMAVY